MLHLNLFCPFCTCSCKNIFIYHFWTHFIDESFQNNFSPSGISLVIFILIRFYMICDARFHESPLSM